MMVGKKKFKSLLVNARTEITFEYVLDPYPVDL